MRLLVDARFLRKGGIGRFLRGVAGPWLGEASVERIRFLGPPGALREWLEERDPRGIAEVVEWDDPMYSPWSQARWALRLHETFEGCDAALFPHYDVPLIRHPEPSVVVVHDLTQFLLPEHYPAHRRWAGRHLLEGAVDRAARVVTVSERSRRDLAREVGLDPHRIAVVPDGVDWLFRPLSPEERRSARSRWESLLPFLLLVGPDRPHKNLAHAADVLALLLQERRELRVVRVGAAGPGPGEERAAALGLSDRWASLGALDDPDLHELYALASCLLFPSLKEGFGLPPFEAAACGTPALAGPEAVPPELVEEAGIAVVPLEPEPWAEAVSAALRGGGVRPRPEGVPRWEEASGRLLAILGDVAGGRA